ncbi:MAG: AMP-binding protein [Proteobacteria bacterium]|nr:AMP-binding protein [Pseudomonadota bacterium]
MHGTVSAAKSSAQPLAPYQQRRAALAARYPRWISKTLDAHLVDVGAAYPDRPYVLTDQVTLSYADVVRQSDQIAKGLRALGVGPGDRVALVVANVPEFVPLVFAIWRLGATAIPVNYLFKAKELAYVIGQSQCRAVITMCSFRGLDYLAALDEIVPDWRKGNFAPFPNLSFIAVLEGDRSDLLTLDGIVGRGAADATPLPPNPVKATDPAVIMYTSGTTGLPKGVIQSHDNLARSGFGGAYYLAFEDGRRILSALPLYHAFALVQGLLAALFVGGAVVPQLTFDATQTFAGIQRHRASYLMLVPTMGVALLEHPDIDKYDLSSLIAVLMAAAPSPVWTWQSMKDRLGLKEVFTGYGMTEVSSATTFTAPDDPLERVATTVGRPFEAGAAGIENLGGLIAEYKTIDPLTGADQPPGAEGELCARGPVTTAGYYAKPKETSELLLPEGWVRSGDLGRIRPDGYIELTGRSKELYKSGGELVSPKEIEELLTGQDAVAQAYVVGVPDDRWGEIGCAWIVRTPNASMDEEQVIALTKDRLARFKVPKHVFFLEASELPTTATGKVQKFQLIEMAKRRLGTSDKPSAGR